MEIQCFNNKLDAQESMQATFGIFNDQTCCNSQCEKTNRTEGNNTKTGGGKGMIWDKSTSLRNG